MSTTDELPLLGIVGPCGAGKTTLIQGLQAYHIPTRHIAQEHSYVGTMWKRITNPDLLIFLDASYPETVRRRNLNWTEEEYQEQHRRLANARENCNLYIFTDGLSPEQVVQRVLAYLRKHAYRV